MKRKIKMTIAGLVDVGLSIFSVICLLTFFKVTVLTVIGIIALLIYAIYILVLVSSMYIGQRKF